MGLGEVSASLTEAKAVAGHVCTPEHLEADLAEIRNDPVMNQRTPQQARSSAENGDAESYGDLKRVMADADKRLAEAQREKRRKQRSIRN